MDLNIIVGHYNTLVTLLTLCALILYVSAGTYSLMSTPNDRYFWESFSWQVYLPSEFMPEICWEEFAEEIYIFFIFRYDA